MAHSPPMTRKGKRATLVAGALLGFEIVLDVDEQAGLPGALLRLAGGAGPSGDPGGQGLLGIIGAQGFQSGEPFLARSPGGYVLAPFQFVPFPLKAAEQVLQVRAAGQEPVNGGTQLRLVAGAVLFRLMLNVALALVPAGNDDGQAMFFADPVTGAADEVILVKESFQPRKERWQYKSGGIDWIVDEYTYTEDDTYLSVYGGEYGGLAFVILISAATEDELFDGMLLDVTNTIRPVK